MLFVAINSECFFLLTSSSGSARLKLIGLVDLSTEAVNLHAWLMAAAKNSKVNSSPTKYL